MRLGLTALDELFAAFEDLREVLDCQDAAAIERASGRVSKAAAAVRAIGAWRSDPAVIERLATLLPLIEAARVRTNLLADYSRQRLAMLASRGAAPARMTYGR